ncbi:MAG: alpha/beta fold hydrolase [Candidatus Dormibacteria bacterium]
MPPVRPSLTRARGAVGDQPVSFVERPGADPPVLLLHGWGASAATFTPLLERMATRRRLLAPDLPGFGESPLGRGGWTTAAYSDLILAWLGGLQVKRYSLLGHSYGGALAIRLATGDHPPDRLLLCAPSGIRPEAAASPSLRVLAYKWLRAAAGVLPPAARSSFRDWLASRMGSADYRAASPGLRPTLVAAVNEDLSPMVGQVIVPTLIIWGSNDLELPLRPHAERLQALLPSSELVVFDGSGHFPFLDQAARFAAVADALMDAEL